MNTEELYRYALEEIEKLKKENQNLESELAECQREIRRLRGVIRNYEN